MANDIKPKFFMIPAYSDDKRNKTNALLLVPDYSDSKRNKTNAFFNLFQPIRMSNGIKLMFLYDSNIFGLQKQ